MSKKMTRVELAALRKIAKAATPGPWVSGNNWDVAGVFTQGTNDKDRPPIPPGACTYCRNHEPPIRVERTNINGRRMLAHWHRSNKPWRPEHLIETEDGKKMIAGNFDYEEGGIIHANDTEYITTFNPAVVLALLDELEERG
jgi:hypothetical protein